MEDRWFGYLNRWLLGMMRSSEKCDRALKISGSNLRNADLHRRRSVIVPLIPGSDLP